MAAILSAGAAKEPQVLEKVNSSDVLEKIAMGERVICDRVAIAGDMDLGRLNLSFDDYGRRIVASKICITNSRLEGDVKLAGCKFAGPVDFSGTAFGGNASFSDSGFAGKAIFNSTQFLGYAQFSDAEFKDQLDFEGALFQKSTSFNNTEFNIYSDFSRVNFKGDALFRDVVFRGYTYFTGAQFDDRASFYRAEFYQETHLDDAKFLGYVNFNESRFKDYTYLSGVKFKGPVSLNMTKMPDWIINWKSLDGCLVYNEAAYLALMQRFWASGDFNAYDDCYYQYRWLKQSYEPLGASKAYDALSWATCGYGTRPQNALALSFVLMILFGLIFWRADLVGKLPVSSPVSLFQGQRKKSGILAFEESIYFSIMMFLTRPPYGLHPVGRWKYLIISEYILGWLLMALFLVTLGRQMIR